MDGWRSAHNQIHEEETRMRTPDKRRNHEAAAAAAAVSLSTHYDDSYSLLWGEADLWERDDKSLQTIMMCYGGLQLEYVYMYTLRGMKSHYAITSQVSFATATAIPDVIRRAPWRGNYCHKSRDSTHNKVLPGDSHLQSTFFSLLALLATTSLLSFSLWLKEAEWFHESKISYASLSKAASMRWNYVCWCSPSFTAFENHQKCLIWIHTAKMICALRLFKRFYIFIILLLFHNLSTFMRFGVILRFS